MTRKIRVLFVCTGNACRSQMAEGWARRLLSDVIEPHSAGLVAAGLNSRACRVMAERSVDIGMQWSKSLDEVRDLRPDVVVMLSAHADDRCGQIEGERMRLRMPVDDPPQLTATCTLEAEIMDVYRRVRDEIRDLVADLRGKVRHLEEQSEGEEDGGGNRIRTGE